MIYREEFRTDRGGWWGWESNAAGPRTLEWSPGQVTSRSPWWIDYNHAPPGAGYLHMLFCTYTRGPIAEHFAEVGGPHRLALEGYPTDYREARVSLRLRGELRRRGARLVMLVQASQDRLTSAWVLTGRPFEVTADWSEQTVEIASDEGLWTCMGARHGRQDYYGRIPLERVLADVNVDIMFILFPLTIAPMGALEGAPHLLRPGKDYPVWRSELPEGYVDLAAVAIRFRE
jgi:hypothetical protein